MSKRECGSCTMCCKLLRVDELEKPQGKWCLQCRIGVGCSIYANRPASCRAFECLWLKGIGTDEMRPDKSKVMMVTTRDGKGLALHVDPTRPHAFASSPEFRSLIQNLIDAGQTVRIVRGNDRITVKPEELK